MPTLRAGLVLSLCAFGAFAADKIVGGPYVVNPGARSATIGWVVETSSVKVSAGEQSQSVPVLRSEKVTLSGLKPGMTVHYEVPAPAGSDAPPEKGWFKTPPVGLSSFQFVVFGDTRTRHELHRKIIEGIVKTEPDFVLHTGDLVSDGYDTAQWPTFFSIEKEMLRKTVFFPVLGNHERNNRRFHEFFDVNTPYYSFNWGTAHFTLLNTDVANVSISTARRDDFWDEQVRWLEADLARNQKADFRFVIMHHPPFTAYQKADHMSKEALSLVPLFEKYNVTAVMAGHDHTYQHHLKNGIRYIITGGGGAPLNPVDQPIPGVTQKVESIEHFVTIKVDGNRARMQAIALDGRVIDTIDFGAAATVNVSGQ